MDDYCNSENGKENIKQPWWKRRSKLEKKLIFFSAVAVLITIITVIVLIIFSTRSPTTCLTPSCIRVSYELMKYMNTSVDPCEDFYQFSCGSFLTNTKLNNSSPFQSVDFSLLENVRDRIREIVEEPQSDNDPRSIVLAKKFYKACTDKEGAVEGRGLKYIKDSLSQIGGWPVLEGNNWKEKDFEWKSATYKLRELGYRFEFFILLLFTPDETNPPKRILKLEMPRGLVDPPSNEWLKNLTADVAVVFGADKMKAEDAFKEVWDFQNALLSSSNENKYGNNKFLKISELQYKFRDIPWLDYINRLQFPAPNISYDDIVSIGNQAYFSRLQNVLRTTPKRIVANYIAWYTALEQGFHLTTETWMWHLLQRHSPSENPNYIIPPRAKICSQLANSLFAWPLKVVYVQKYLSGNAKAQVTELLQNIKDEFKVVITDLEWMDQKTRVKALEKIMSSKNYVVFANDLMNLDKMEERYMGIQVYEDNLLASLLNVNYHTTNLRFRKLHEPIEIDEEVDSKHVTSTRISYSEEDNIIRVPAGLLQGIFYDEKRPEYLNYGAIGSMLGMPVFRVVFENSQHKSMQYKWISMHTRTSYNEKLSCVAKHYGKYLVPEINQYLNSSKTRHADLADVAAVKLAYNAYEKWESENGPEQNLPGLNFTPKQLFWISSAIRFCEKKIPVKTEHFVEHYRTSPGKYRVLGVLRNSAEFSDDFNCPADSYMNDNNKCDIW